MHTKDNVPVTINAILRYKVMETRSKDAILNVQNFNEMIKQVSQTTLRNNIGSALFQDILSKREDINHIVKNVISEEAGSWGIEVTGVEIRQVIIPQELESAMSMQAQAEAVKVHGNTIVLVPSETLYSMGFGNLATTIAYLENTRRAISKHLQQRTSKISGTTTDE